MMAGGCLTRPGSIPGYILGAGLAELGGAGNILAKVDLTHDLLDLAGLCRPHVNLARNIRREGVRLQRPLEAGHG